VVNSHVTVTGEFTRNTDFRIPADDLHVALEARLRERLVMLDATELALRLMGDTIFSNMIVLGAAWQKGWVPLSLQAIVRAIALNGAAVERNQRAFEIGRWAVVHADEAERVLAPYPGVVPLPATPEERIAFRDRHLALYQSQRLVRRYRRLVDQVSDPRLREAVAKGYHKVLAYKDEYEVARLLKATEVQARDEFEGDLRLTYHLAPPVLARHGPDGRPRKRAFGGWIARLFGPLAALKVLRGTPLDPFGHTAERRMERALIRQYEADMAEVLGSVRSETLDAAVALAELPLSIRGFGPVKAANAVAAERRRAELLAVIRGEGADLRQAAE
jgi:indolepyruvate ferredoxin oxidoreductase